MITKEEREAIRAKVKNAKECGLTGGNIAVAVFNDYIETVPKLLDSLDEWELECCYLDLRDNKRKIEIERDNYKRRAEDLEAERIKLIEHINVFGLRSQDEYACDICIYSESSCEAIEPCVKCAPPKSRFKFDEARFTTGGDGE